MGKRTFIIEADLNKKGEIESIKAGSELKQFISILQAKTIKEVCEKVRMSKRYLPREKFKTAIEARAVRSIQVPFKAGYNQAVSTLNKKLDKIMEEVG